MSVRWLRDDRAMRWATRLYVLGMRVARDKRAFEGERHTAAVAADRQRRGDAPPGWLTRWSTRVTSSTVQEMVVWTASPRRRSAASRVVYVHGGGYIHPLTPDYWRLVRRLVRDGSEVVVPAYPLAPDATFDEVAPHLADLAERGDLPTVLMGDSAGGALVLSVTGMLRDQGRALPRGVVAISPWLDATLADPAVSRLEATDPMLAESGLRAAGRWWSGVREPDDPAISPAHMSLSGLPPVDVLIGDHDILRPAVDELAGRARHDNVDLTVHEVTAMFHVWVTRAIPEGRRARARLSRLVAARVG